MIVDQESEVEAPLETPLHVTLKGYKNRGCDWPRQHSGGRWHTNVAELRSAVVILHSCAWVAHDAKKLCGGGQPEVYCDLNLLACNSKHLQ